MYYRLPLFTKYFCYVIYVIYKIHGTVDEFWFSYTTNEIVIAAISLADRTYRWYSDWRLLTFLSSLSNKETYTRLQRFVAIVQQLRPGRTWLNDFRFCAIALYQIGYYWRIVTAMYTVTSELFPYLREALPILTAGWECTTCSILSLLSFLLHTAAIPSQTSSSLSSSEDDVAAVSSLESRVGAGARSTALREISVYKASDDDRWVARGHWSLPPSLSPHGYGNLSHGDWTGVVDESSKSKTDNADWWLRGHEKQRTHEGHRKTRRHGNRGWTAARRRRTGRHVKQTSFNDVQDYEVDEPEMPSSCAELQCSGSARCVVDQRNGHARCRCPIGTTGIYCEQGQYFNVS